MSADFDEAIDRAVREMLDVEPPADLRARVIAQLPASGSRLPAFGFRLPASGFRLPASGSLAARVASGFSRNGWGRVASGFSRNGWGRVASGFSRNRLILAAAAAILIAVFVARRSEPVAPAPIVAHGVDRHLPGGVVEAPAAPSIVPAPAAPPLAAAARAPRSTPAERGIIAAASIDSDASADVAIDPLTSIAPIAVAPIAQDSIAPAQIAVRPLNTITDVQIAPLTPPDRRN